MNKRYHYNQHGRYTGYSSNQGPYAWVGGLVLLIVIVNMLHGC